jgi:hypothetical protein
MNEFLNSEASWLRLEMSVPDFQYKSFLPTPAFPQSVALKIPIQLFHVNIIL